MTMIALTCWLLGGSASWIAAGRVAARELRLRSAAHWAAPLLCGAVAVTVLAQLDRSVPAFRDVAVRAAGFWVLGAAGFALTSQLGPRLLVRARWWLAGCAVTVQALALGLGSGAAGRISLSVPVIGTIVISELTRVLLIVATAGVATRLEPILDQPLRRGALRPLVAIGGLWFASAAMSFAAHDVGAATLTLVVLALAALFVLGRPVPTVMILGLCLVGGLVATVAFPHAAARISVFVSPPHGDRIEQGRMALFAASSGGAVGSPHGGASLQYVGSTLDDDFLLAAVARVMGLAGVAAVLVALTALTSSCLRPLSVGAPYGVRRWVSVSAASLLAAQLVLSAGGVFAVVPATGVPVPFTTGSGASLLALSCLLGIATAARPGADHPTQEPSR